MTTRQSADPDGRDAITAQAVGEALAGRLYAVEAAIDGAMRESALLISMLPSARADLWLSAVTGQRIFEDSTASVQALAKARGHMVSTHNSLAALARRMGLDVLATGPINKPDDPALIDDVAGSPHTLETAQAVVGETNAA